MLKRTLAIAALVAGCGGSSHHAASPPATPVSAQNPISGTIPAARPADFAPAIAVYRRHVRRELGAMLSDVAALRSARDLAAARRAWLRADAHYEAIGAAYGAFGTLDARINGSPDGLPRGVRDRDFTGLHRIELALWSRRSTRDAAAPAARLATEVERLREKVGRLKIDPFEYSLRSHEVLEDSLHLELSGRASPWAGAALVALRANVRGTEVVLASLKPLIARRNPARARAAETALKRLRRAIPDGRWDALPRRERERIAGLTAAAAERLAYVPEIIDPRPPAPKQRVLG